MEKDVKTTDELIDDMVQAIDSIEIAHLSNWSRLSSIMSGLAEIKKSIAEREKQHNADKRKLMDRIEEISKGEVKFYDVDENWGPGLRARVDNAVKDAT